MTMVSIGDMSQYFMSRQNNTQIKTQLNTLTQELSTGRAADMTAHLGADRARLSDLDRRLSLSQGYADATRATSQSLATMQVALDGVEDRRATLADQLIQITPQSSLPQQASAATAARQTFADIVSGLNTRFGGSSLFAGTATDQPALADADTMLASLRTALAGAVTATDVTTIVDDWFDNPVGGFATTGYLGDAGAALSRSIDTNSDITITARADQPAIRDLLKAGAMAALATDGTLALPNSTTSKLLYDAGVRMMSAAAPLTAMRGDLGLAEERVDTASARHSAQLAAFGIMRNDLTQVDPFSTASALNAVQAQLETHYTLTARLSSLSLVGYLR